MGYFNNYLFNATGQGQIFDTSFYFNLNQLVDNSGFITNSHDVFLLLQNYYFNFINIPDFLNNLLLNFLFRYRNSFSYYQLTRFFNDEVSGFKLLFNDILDHMGQYYDPFYNNVDYRTTRWSDLTFYFRAKTISNGVRGHATNVQLNDLPEYIKSPISIQDGALVYDVDAINNTNDIAYN